MSLNLSSKLRQLNNNSILFHCPGCDESHVISVNSTGRPNWTYNGDPEKPTFTPSIKVTGMQCEIVDHQWNGEWKRDEQGNPIPGCCHSFITDGNIQFLDDCTHPLKDQTVPLPDIPY